MLLLLLLLFIGFTDHIWYLDIDLPDQFLLNFFNTVMITEIFIVTVKIEAEECKTIEVSFELQGVQNFNLIFDYLLTLSLIIGH